MGILTFLVVLLAVCGFAGPIVLAIVLAIIQPDLTEPHFPRWAFFLIALSVFAFLAIIATTKYQFAVDKRKTKQAKAIKSLPELRRQGIDLRDEGLRPIFSPALQG